MICLNCGEEFEKDIIDKADAVCPNCKKTNLAKGNLKATRRKEDAVSIRCSCDSKNLKIMRKENKDGLIITDYQCKECFQGFTIYQIESNIIKKKR